jgi:hypothetical protein
MVHLEVYIHTKFADMYTDFKNYKGNIIEQVFLEWFYLNDVPVSVIRLYVKIHSYFDITCCEEKVVIREQKEPPRIVISGEYVYKPVEQTIKWLHQCGIVSVKYLTDSNDIRRGLLFIFEHNHNFIFYNRGYELDDDDKFEIDVNVDALPYKII